MREVINEAEDTLEYLVLEKVFPSSDGELGCHPSLEKVREDIYLIAGEVKVVEKVMEEIDLMKKIEHTSSSKDAQRGAESSGLNSSSSAPPIREDAVVGFEDYAKQVKDRLCGQQSKLQVIPICGMGGIGKTTLAKKVYEDPCIVEEFVIRVWVTISQDYSVQRIVSTLLESLKEFSTGIWAPNDEERVRKILVLRKYLVVMDDMWSREVWDAVRRVFPDVGNGSRIMLTTRLYDVASHPDPSSKLCEMQLMNADQSWSLLKQKVFIDDDCPFQLEKIGKEIVRSCKGLPLAIVVIAGLVSTVSRDPASWQEIAKKVKSAKTAEQEQIEEILSLSYTHLPQYLRPCFMYMGSFPEDQEINVSRLVRLWVAEGFVKRPNSSSESLEEEAEECLEDLVKRNLVVVVKRKCDGRIKRCSLHDLMRDLSIRKAHESKFLLSLMDRNVIENLKNERRVSVDSFSLTYLSSIDGSSSTIRTVVCSRNQSVKKLEFVKSVRLLRVLDAEPVDMKSLPDRLFDLFHLRYLAVRYNYGIPLALWNLQNLQTLIIHEKNETEFGVGITCNLWLHWCMPQLRHVYFHGTIGFDDPKGSTSSLENLQTVSYVSHHSCTEKILKMIPSLKKLKIDCSPCGDAACLNDLVHLHKLESLEIYAGCWVQSRPKYYNFTFPMKLKKLCLRDLRLPWNDMMVVGSLPDLRVLKIKGRSCVGSTWETTQGQFPQLEFLLIEASDFENWITESSHFPRLKRLLLDSCWCLNGIPSDIGEISTLELIEIKGEVKKSLVKSGEEIQNEQEDIGNNTLQVLWTNAKPFR